MTTRFLILFLILISSSCSKNKEIDYKDLFVLKAILDNSNKPNPLATCQTTMTAMQLCAATAPEFSAFTLTEAIFIGTLSKNQFANSTDYCNNLINSEQLKNQSDGIKECSFKCDTSYWETRRNLNICNSSFSKMATTDLINDSGTGSCKRNCFLPTNNNP